MEGNKISFSVVDEFDADHRFIGVYHICSANDFIDIGAGKGAVGFYTP